MVKIHFQANYLPNHRVFRVWVKMGDRKKIVERMSISRFIRFARATDKPLKIGGWTINETDSDTLPQVRAYFKQVADAYMQARWGKPGNN